ncbi:MAG TPA: metal-dependent hydrolase [Leptospiraceae bacterium]|nr:metal-dependent hydrolase [Leptospiraceae bacterium]HMW08198.1 metal-dependent hydrolase [Leptospiraceae bacterium]HMX33348.1 metal-dependent hydrolase [Leptospiraceae bacterium]HMY34093.1 metal-dependent hydrolase [Leptospiraceae bacterium]HMZ64610.1 metal-dependent hydrolase [Leptospiraceae bacterium]
MPTIFSHGIAALSFSSIFNTQIDKIRFYFLVFFFSILPDIDVISFLLGIPYSHPLGHRGFTHSILFSILIPIPFLYFFYRNRDFKLYQICILWFAFFLSSFSHAVLDAMTNGGLGVCLFYPVSYDRFFFPFRPIQVSPIGKQFFSKSGINVLKSEIIWIWAPSFLFFILTETINKIISISKRK